MAADRQESCLKNKAQADREEIESHRMKNSPTQLDGGVYDRGEKTDRRSNEEITVHSDSLFYVAVASWQFCNRARHDQWRPLNCRHFDRREGLWTTNSDADTQWQHQLKP